MRYLFSVAGVMLLIAMALTAVITAQSKPRSDATQPYPPRPFSLAP